MALRLAAFDLDGTLLRGQTACEAIAKGIGRIERMRELERLESTDIEEMAEWYSDFTFSDLCNHLAAVRVAPGIDEGFALLREHGFKIAIVSLTWEFGVEWFADRLGADYSVGTGLSADGLISHFWPKDKALWLRGMWPPWAIRAGTYRCSCRSGIGTGLVRRFHLNWIERSSTSPEAICVRWLRASCGLWEREVRPVEHPTPPR